MAYPFYTIGHGTRPSRRIRPLAASGSGDLVADVRTMPRSRANPQYNHDVLPRILAQSYISCRRIAALGGLRGKNRSVATTVNAYRQNSSFHNYADYAICASFRSGLTELDELGRHQRCAIMCAETLWWRCHRRIIADYLLAAGRTVIHILGRSIPNQRT